MPRLSKAERLKIIREALNDPNRKPFQTEAEKQAAKGKKARRKGESFQRLIARDLQNIGKQAGFDKWDIRSRSVTGHGDDIVFAPDAFYRFGFLRVECKHFVRQADFDRIFRQHAQKCADKPLHRQTGVPILVHRSNHQPIMVTMRQGDLGVLSGGAAQASHRPEELVTVPWESVLQVLAAKVRAGEPVESHEEEPIQF
jgi:hypothetical protein